MASLIRFLRDRLRRSVDVAKSAVDRPWNRSFLGYTMVSRGFLVDDTGCDAAGLLIGAT
ncbi:hypothetical protein [Inquilinus limosus]|nr:hypothetical protein [Inquilinus limosus]